MTPDYCPVTSPTGMNHFLTDFYAGDGKSCIYAGVLTLDSHYRDELVTQGLGVVDGTYFDGEICHAYRPSAAAKLGAVVYSNGILLGGGGDWPRVLAERRDVRARGRAARGDLLLPQPGGRQPLRLLVRHAPWSSETSGSRR